MSGLGLEVGLWSRGSLFMNFVIIPRILSRGSVLIRAHVLTEQGMRLRFLNTYPLHKLSLNFTFPCCQATFLPPGISRV